jgi:hypothetical protein
MLPPLHFFIKQEARHAANIDCSEMDFLMCLMTLNIFGRKFSVIFPTREDWSTECVDLVAPD